jgi:hypothetical protein
VIAGDLAREELFFAIGVAGQVRRVPLPAFEIYAAAARQTPARLDLHTSDDEVLRAWSQAEAERAAP